MCIISANTAFWAGLGARASRPEKAYNMAVAQTRHLVWCAGREEALCRKAKFPHTEPTWHRAVTSHNPPAGRRITLMATSFVYWVSHALPVITLNSRITKMVCEKIGRHRERPKAFLGSTTRGASTQSSSSTSGSEGKMA